MIVTNKKIKDRAERNSKTCFIEIKDNMIRLVCSLCGEAGRVPDTDMGFQKFVFGVQSFARFHKCPEGSDGGQTE